jgi:hypothetical protein
VIVRLSSQKVLDVQHDQSKHRRGSPMMMRADGTMRGPRPVEETLE